jgi:hypothetical protein
MAMQQLDLPDVPWTQAYGRVVRALKEDATLRAVVHPAGWRTYTDEDTGDAPPGSDTLPSLELLPHGMKGTAESPIAQYSPLGIAITIATAGSDMRDLLNLWWAVHRAIFPGDGARALVTSIRADFAGSASGAQLETVQLGLPAITPDVKELGNQILLASGSLILIMRVPK